MTATASEIFGSDHDLITDLKERGVELSAPMADSQIDALASYYMGEMADADREIARYREARDAELARIAMRYDTLMLMPTARREHLERLVCTLAQRAEFGAKKSRAVGNGTYGKRAKPEAIKIVDAGAALDWAEKHCPGAVKEKITYSVVHKYVEPAVIACVHSTGEVPAGFAHESESETYFAKPEI